jgi:hypothetical protein
MGCHPLYAALDHCAPGSDHEGHQIVSYALNDLKGHLPLDCFLALARTAAWQRLMGAWRQQAEDDPEDRRGFYAILRQREAPNEAAKPASSAVPIFRDSGAGPAAEL